MGNEVQGSVEKTPNVRRFPADWLNLMVSWTLSNYHDHVYGVVRTMTASPALL
jgi:hypothetical protein